MIKTRRNSSGTSLIEVLVVMVVLLIGILAAFKLFPAGFISIKQSAEYIQATRLCSAEMERLKLHSGNLPGAIVPVKYQNDSSGNLVLTTDDTVTPDNLGLDKPSALLGADPLYIQDVNRIRHVVGESTNIPQSGQYMFGFAPVVDPIYSQLFAVYGNALQVNEADSTETQFPMNLNPDSFSFGIDYDAGKIMLPPAPANLPTAIYGSNPAIQYRISFTYYDSSYTPVREETVVSKLVSVTSGASTWLDLYTLLPTSASPDKTLGIVRDSVQAARVFTRLTPSDTFTPYWPYEIKLDPTTPWQMTFNPSGYSYQVSVNRFRSASLVANMDYDVLDWHIIREDRRIPDSGYVKLTLPDLKIVGEIDVNQKTYGGLASNPPFANTAMVIIDLLTGTQIPAANYTVDSKSGAVQFTNNTDYGKTVRVFYKAHNDWAVQVQKASQLYIISANPAVSFGLCFVGKSDNGVTGNATRLYFPASDLGKQVTIREYFYRDNSNTLNRGNNETFYIKTDATDPNGPYIDIADEHSDAANFDYTTGYAVRGVEGASVKVRAIWARSVRIDPAKLNSTDPLIKLEYAQTIWNKYDADGILTRSSGGQ